ncbi:uncharacterized protein LOC128952250 [Oppia nitens]|uniref:uncharacterized protein LOC128952250 n=1 Tax=Oppia nitens TaxID=1686743 RepID=UPI0023DA4A8F|nr:uncharacterized protein LOC128952250 [Oppia nitens]
MDSQSIDSVDVNNVETSDTKSANFIEDNASTSKSTLIIPEVSSNAKNMSNKSSDNSTEDKSLKLDPKDKSKYVTVGSRFMQSTKDWVDKRSNASKQRHVRSGSATRGTVGTRPPSRNPTPNAKTKKASTPISTDKSLNFSHVSVINVRDNQKPEIKLKGKGLITGRKSLAPKRLPFVFDSDANTVTTASNRVTPMSVSVDNDTKVKEMENSVMTSIYLQSVFLNLKAKRMKSERQTNALTKITQIWSQTNELRTQLFETQKCIITLKETIDSIDILEKQKNILEEYLKIRTQLDSLFNCLAKLIGEQKLLFKVENCTQNDFEKLNDLMKLNVDSNQSDSMDKASKISDNVVNAKKVCDDIKSLENEFKDCYKLFINCVKDYEKYERIERKINPQKCLSISKLF